MAYGTCAANRLPNRVKFSDCFGLHRDRFQSVSESRQIQPVFSFHLNVTLAASQNAAQRQKPFPLFPVEKLIAG